MKETTWPTSRKELRKEYITQTEPRLADESA